VTVLFTDLVGSTALQSSVAPDVADELRRDHFTVLRQAIAGTGGTEVAFRLSGFPEVVSVVAVN
jgi:class 3 adenylate cyclase